MPVLSSVFKGESPVASLYQGTALLWQRFLRWKSIDWLEGSWTGNPGPNTYHPSQVWVDEEDNLHLLVSNVSDVWRNAHVETVEWLGGYGTYRLTVESDVSDLDPQVVLGLSTYDQNQPENFNEIDIEVAYWVDHPSGNNLWYTVFESDGTPFNNMPGKKLTYDGPTVQEIIWREDAIIWSTFDLNGNRLHTWRTYDTNIIPTPANEKTILNLWLVGGDAPASDIEVVLSDFSYDEETEIPDVFTEEIVDDFENTYSINWWLWEASYGSISQDNGTGIVAILNNYNAAFITDNYFVFDESSVAAELEFPSESNGSKECYFEILGTEAGNQITFAWLSGTLLMRVRSGGTLVEQDTIPYDPVDHRWLRMRENGQSIFFETSPDANVWTNQLSFSSPSWIETDTVAVSFGAGFWGTEDPSNFLIHNVNNFN